MHNFFCSRIYTDKTSQPWPYFHLIQTHPQNPPQDKILGITMIDPRWQLGWKPFTVLSKLFLKCLLVPLFTQPDPFLRTEMTSSCIFQDFHVAIVRDLSLSGVLHFDCPSSSALFLPDPMSNNLSRVLDLRVSVI